MPVAKAVAKAVSNTWIVGGVLEKLAVTIAWEDANLVGTQIAALQT